MRLSSSLLLAPPFLPCHLAMSCCVPVENQSVTLCDGFHAELTVNAQHSKPVAARLQVCKSVQECARVCKRVQECARMCKSVQECARVCKSRMGENLI